MSFRKVALEVAKLAKVRESRVAGAMDDDGPLFRSATELRTENLEEAPERKVLREYMASLPEEVVLKLQTLMYVGRDRWPFSKMHAHLKSQTPDSADAIRTMVEKTPLGSYLEAGIAIADDWEQDLEGSFD